MTPGNPVVGSTILRRPAIQSPNYVAGVSGWSINADGSAEFNNLTIRGNFVGTNYELTSTGAYFYSGTPAAGNLIASVTTALGTDGFGNNTIPEVASYGGGLAIVLSGASLAFFTGTLATGWSELGELDADSGGDLLSTFTGALELSGNLAVAGTATINGSGDTGTGLPGGVPTGGPNSGTFAGHTHDFDGHTHAL